MNFKRPVLPASTQIPTGKDVLRHIHSGNLLSRTLPKLLRAGTILWFLFFVVQWLSIWPAVYANYERWGLIQAFFALLVTLVAALAVLSITQVRARHLETLPSDDFYFLRISAVFCRWIGEVALILTLSAAMSALLSSVSLPLLPFFPPNADPNTIAGLGLRLLSILSLVASFLTFLFLYSLATGIDLLLAIEFNTRTERVPTSSGLAESRVR